jgi:hypothetical protein
VVNRIHIVGGGWSGIAAAVRAVQAGLEVHLYEMAPQLGGRARSVVHQGQGLDNGQHVLVGACQQTLELMRALGLDPTNLLTPIPLRLALPSGPQANWMAHSHPVRQFWGLITDPDWSWSERWQWSRTLAALRCSHPHQWVHQSVADWLDRFANGSVRHWLGVLCVCVMNLPSHLASASVFLKVLQSALGQPSGSVVLVPRVGLSQLLPQAAQAWLKDHGAFVHLRHRVGDLGTLLSTGPVVLAASVAESARLATPHAPEWASAVQALSHSAIATVYTQWDQAPPRLSDPLVFLPPDQDQPAQVIIDLGAIGHAHHAPGSWAWVVSHAQGTREDITQGVLIQAQQHWAKQPRVLGTLVEKRATINCMPDTHRPPIGVATGLWACGDAVDGDFPSTLEGSIVSGQACIQAVLANS